MDERREKRKRWIQGGQSAVELEVVDPDDLGLARAMPRAARGVNHNQAESVSEGM